MCRSKPSLQDRRDDTRRERLRDSIDGGILLVEERFGVVRQLELAAEDHALVVENDLWRLVRSERDRSYDDDLEHPSTPGVVEQCATRPQVLDLAREYRVGILLVRRDPQASR